MIQKTVSAAFRLRDGFTGKLITDSATRFLLDGRSCRPVVKSDGYVILMNLAPGDHVLSVDRRGYRTETVAFTLSPGSWIEDGIMLKPDRTYRFPAGTRRVCIRVCRGKKPAASETLLVGMTVKSPMKLAQDPPEEPESRMRIFYNGNESAFPVPARYLAADPKVPEILFIQAIDKDTAILKAPMASSHARGTQMIPVQPYTTDENGIAELIFRNAGRMAVYAGGQMYLEDIEKDGQTVEMELEG